MDWGSIIGAIIGAYGAKQASKPGKFVQIPQDPLQQRAKEKAVGYIDNSPTRNMLQGLIQQRLTMAPTSFKLPQGYGGYNPLGGGSGTGGGYDFGKIFGNTPTTTAPAPVGGGSGNPEDPRTRGPEVNKADNGVTGGNGNPYGGLVPGGANGSSSNYVGGDAWKQFNDAFAGKSNISSFEISKWLGAHPNLVSGLAGLLGGPVGAGIGWLASKLADHWNSGRIPYQPPSGSPNIVGKGDVSGLTPGGGGAGGVGGSGGDYWRGGGPSDGGFDPFAGIPSQSGPTSDPWYSWGGGGGGASNSPSQDDYANYISDFWF